MSSIDLNCDFGESFGRWQLGDEALLELVSSVNIACGFHAGDPSSIRRAVRLAAECGVSIGAHPSYPDLRGFGRVAMDLPLEQVHNDILYQLGALEALCRAEETTLRYVKPHGALYNRMADDWPLAQAVAQAVRVFNAELPLLLLCASPTTEALRDAGYPVKLEGFVDRQYLPNGRLAARSEAGSVIHDPKAAADQARQLAQGTVKARDGSSLTLSPDSLCLHGDGPAALTIARRTRHVLEAAGCDIRAFR